MRASHHSNLEKLDSLIERLAGIVAIADDHDNRVTALELRADAAELARPGLVVLCACGAPVGTTATAMQAGPASCSSCAAP